MFRFFQVGLYLQQPRVPSPVYKVLPDGHEPDDEIRGYVHDGYLFMQLNVIIALHKGSARLDYQRN
jgi:hypothetical protein